jgi:hypothetical protein
VSPDGREHSLHDQERGHGLIADDDARSSNARDHERTEASAATIPARSRLILLAFWLVIERVFV